MTGQTSAAVITEDDDLIRWLPFRADLLMLGVALLLILAIAGLSYRNWRAFNGVNEQLNISQVMTRGADELLSTLVDAESGQRGYLLVGRDPYLEPYRQAVSRVPSILSDLISAAMSRPDQAQRIESLKPLVQKRLSELQETIDLRQSKGLDAALAVVETDQGKATMDEIRKIIAEIEKVADARRDAQYDDLVGRGNSIGLIGSLGGVILFMFLFASTVAIQRGTRAREKLNEQLKQSRDWYQTTLASIGDGVIATDEKGRVTLLNAVSQSLTGWSQEQADGVPLEQVFVISNEETGAPVENPVTKALREGKIVGLANHTKLTARDGSEVPIDDSAAPIRDAKGNIIGVVLVFRDISERKKAEEQIHHLAAIVESSDDAIIGKDLKGRIISWNKAAERIFGYSKAEAIGKSVSIISADHDEMPMIIDRIKRGERIDHYDTVRKTKSGRPVDVSVTVSPMRDSAGRIVGASKISRDITQAKQAAERLRVSEEQAREARDWLQTTLASIGDGVIATDEKGRVTFLNGVSQTLTGWSQEEAAGVPLDQVFVISNEETGAPVENPVTKALREGRIVALANHTKLTAKDGREIPIDDSAAPIRDAAGNVIGVVLVFRDVTDRKEAEEALNKSVEDLQRVNEDLNQFAFAASHDFQEPLRMITSYSQLLVKNYDGPVDGEAAVCVGYIEEGTRRMRDLLADLLAFTQLTADGHADDFVDLDGVSDKVTQNLKAAIEESNAAVTTGALPAVRGHEVHFVQLFQNLIGNAIKYRSERSPRIHISAEKHDGAWRFAVADNGIGISPEYHDKIFGVFKRLHGKNIPGTGIGLAICQRVVERYRGKIWVESELDKGATFFFTVPIAGGGGG